MMKALGTLKSIYPSFEHIELDKKRAEYFSDLLEDLKCHTKGTEYMIKFFKDPLLIPTILAKLRRCTLKSCRSPTSSNHHLRKKLSCARGTSCIRREINLHHNVSMCPHYSFFFFCMHWIGQYQYFITLECNR
jgi:hypothetical protein